MDMELLDVESEKVVCNLPLFFLWLFSCIHVAREGKFERKPFSFYKLQNSMRMVTSLNKCTTECLVHGIIGYGL